MCGYHIKLNFKLKIPIFRIQILLSEDKKCIFYILLHFEIKACFFFLNNYTLPIAVVRQAISPRPPLQNKILRHVDIIIN